MICSLLFLHFSAYNILKVKIKPNPFQIQLCIDLCFLIGSLFLSGHCNERDDLRTMFNIQLVQVLHCTVQVQDCTLTAMCGFKYSNQRVIVSNVCQILYIPSQP